jgi:hypothetical protein
MDWTAIWGIDRDKALVLVLAIVAIKLLVDALREGRVRRDQRRQEQEQHAGGAGTQVGRDLIQQQAADDRKSAPVCMGVMLPVLAEILAVLKQVAANQAIEYEAMARWRAAQSERDAAWEARDRQRMEENERIERQFREDQLRVIAALNRNAEAWVAAMKETRVEMENLRAEVRSDMDAMRTAATPRRRHKAIAQEGG